MKKLIAISSVLISLLCLSSCYDSDVAYKVIKDNEYKLRAIQIHDTSTAVLVDEYYYAEDVYDGHIEINITIPKEINGMPVVSLGRYALVEISNSNYIHDRSDVTRGSIEFAVMCNSYFKEGTTFDINLTIEADLWWIELESYGGSIVFYNQTDSFADTPQEFSCNFYVTITGESKNYYTDNGEIYSRDNGSKLLDAPFGHVLVEPNLD